MMQFGPVPKKIKGYGQHLARQVSISFGIDPAEGVEPVVNLQHIDFPGEVTISEPKTAFVEAQKDRSDLALGVDGSKLDTGGTGVAVLWRYTFSNGLKIHKTALGKNKEIFDAELWGISDALGVALREATPRRTHKITVFSDSQVAIRELQDSKKSAGQAFRIQIYERARRLQAQGGKVTIR